MNESNFDSSSSHSELLWPKSLNAKSRYILIMINSIRFVRNRYATYQVIPPINEPKLGASKYSPLTREF